MVCGNDGYYSGLIGLATGARIFNTTLLNIWSRFFQLESVKTTKGLIKGIGIISVISLVIIGIIWLIITLGPLWIIAIILLFIFLSLTSR